LARPPQPADGLIVVCADQQRALLLIGIAAESMGAIQGAARTERLT
jgi:hypothetical protein